jgi:hypothetical protein
MIPARGRIPVGPPCHGPTRGRGGPSPVGPLYRTGGRRVPSARCRGPAGERGGPSRPFAPILALVSSLPFFFFSKNTGDYSRPFFS